MFGDFLKEDALTELFRDWHKIKQKAEKYDWIMGYLNKVEKEVEKGKVYEVTLTWEKNKGFYFGHQTIIDEMKIKDVKSLLDKDD